MKEKILATSENVKKIAEASGFDVKTVKKILILADVLEREVFMRQVAPQVRAKVFTDLRTRYAAAIDKMRRAGYDKAVPDQEKLYISLSKFLTLPGFLHDFDFVIG